ncbi:hypothetical protein H4217_003548 [Coemansia sp. RSA 1939]|nr:hypothetical protein H4217_003548 [Coemansia sp. RSA 1939]KAJ2598794.1 hypothetical protein EV177_007457 [Coemansia sp. RSA 1804]
MTARAIGLKTLQRRQPQLQLQHQRPFSSGAPEKTEGPLAGTRVLDLTRVLAGPYCTMLLGDLGADVIKVEHPTRGDDTRAWGPPFKAYARAPQAKKETPDNPLYTAPPRFPGESAYYLCVNRNKRSVAVDLKKAAGREIVAALAREADVVVENFVPGRLAAMGLGYAELSRINPRLVYASISGYGATGPYSRRPGYDVIIEAEAGLMHITGDEHGAPVKVGVAVTDIATGLYAHGAIMAALLARIRTGRGQHLDLSLMQTQTALLANIASNYLVGGHEAQRWGTRHPSIAPYEVFATADGRVCIGAGNDAQFASLCRRIGRADMAARPEFRTNAARVANRRALAAAIAAALGAKSTADVLALLDGAAFPFAPVNTIAQTFAHPQLRARRVVRQIDHPFVGPIRLVGPAVHYSCSDVAIRRPPPMLGQHTDAVLRGVLGYSDAQVAHAVRSGATALYDYDIQCSD